MQEKHISVEGDAGLVVAGNATHDGATANNQTSNVINIHHHGAATNDARSLTMEGRMNRLAQCSSCAVAHQQQTRIRRWLVATSALALMASAVTTYITIGGGSATDPALALQGSLCHHEGKAHSPGGVARMADSQLYVCAPAAAGGVAFWESVEEAAKRRNASS
ncbi:hypothetical protein [Ralstonia edaphi]|uniref:hypothetical protein n=1 Tax=Ralstonia edaphi TaxID=3058599 RepID=UPI00292E06C4|nr:hypothetical protein [Ralstonia sp. LMG 6871]